MDIATLSFSQTRSTPGTATHAEHDETIASASYLRHRGSTPDISGHIQKLSGRRFSLFDFMKRKSTSALNKDDTITEEDDDIFEDDKKVNDQNEKLLISFADIYGGKDDEGHENRLFQHDSLDAEHTLSFFGKKGKAKGEFQDAKDITILSGNRLLITDLVNNRLQLFNASGRLLLMYSGTDVAEPWAASYIDNTTVAVTSRRNKCVRVLNLDGKITKSFGENILSSPTGIAVDKNGNFIVCDAGANTVAVYSRAGTFVRHLGNPETTNETFSNPRYVCVSPTRHIIISDSGNHRIMIFSSSFEFVRSFGCFGKGNRQFKSPYGVCTNEVGDIFVADHYNSRISMFTSNGVFIRHLMTSRHGLRLPQGLALQSGTIMFVTHGDLKASEVLVYKLACNTDDNKIEAICHL